MLYRNFVGRIQKKGANLLRGLRQLVRDLSEFGIAVFFKNTPLPQTQIDR